MAHDTRSPESSYHTRNNIIIPKTEVRTALVVRNTAAQHEELDTTDTPKTHSRATNVITGTYVAQTKEA